jgi:lysophospholipase L1-like esterase
MKQTARINRLALYIALLLALQVLPVAAQRAQKPANPAKATAENWVPTWATSQQLVRFAPQGRGASPGTATPAATPPTATAPATAPAAQAPNPASQPPVQPAILPPTAPSSSGPGGFAPPDPPSPSLAGTPKAPLRSGGARNVGQAPAPPPLPPLQTLNNQTIRMILRTSIGGKRVRVKLANAFNGTPVEIGAAHIGIRDKESAIVAGSDRALTFGGQSTFRMWPGAVVVSDPVDLTVAPLTDLAVSLYLPAETGPPTTHATGLRPTYISEAGDFTGKPELPGATVRMSYYWLSGVEVAAPPNTPLIVAFGDSITDGARSTPDTHNTWPAILATRLAANKATARFAIINQGINGNRVLTDGTGFAGVNALARLDRDVLNQPGVKWLMLLEGINDIGNGTAPTSPNPVTTEQLIWGMRQIVERARMHGIKVAGCTILPYEGAGYFRETGETIRQAVNTWIRTSGTFDAVVDFDAATRDPANPRRLRPEFDPGDHLHPNDAGYRAMAQAVDLRLFRQ